jgi:hypothetical protein
MLQPPEEKNLLVSQAGQVQVSVPITLLLSAFADDWLASSCSF